MTLGIYTLSKIKPFADNIQGLEHSVQARYHAKSGEEIAKLLYYRSLETSQAVLDDPNFESLDTDEQALAFCRADGQILVSDRDERTAIEKCMEEKFSTSNGQ